MNNTSRNAYFVGTINGSDFPSNSVANEFWLRTNYFFYKINGLKLPSVRSLQYLREISACSSSKVMTVGAERRIWFNGSDCAEGVQEAAQVLYWRCEAHMTIDIARGIGIQRPPRLFVLFGALPTAWNQVGSIPKTKCMLFGWCDMWYPHIYIYLER